MWMAGTLAAQTFIEMSDPRWSLRCAAIAIGIGGAVGRPFVKKLSFIDEGLWGFEVNDADGYVLAFFHLRRDQGLHGNRQAQTRLFGSNRVG
jgi:hypothetical protein